MDHTEKLLEEYKLCQNTTMRLEDTIWKTSAVLGFGSIGSFAVVISQRFEWPSIIILGVFFFFISVIWLFMARRWWSIQHATFLRMKHLEEELHFYQISYIYHKDYPKVRKLNLSPNGVSLSQRHIEELNNLVDGKFYLRGVTSSLRLLPFFIFFSWFEYGFHRWSEVVHLYSIQSPKQFIIFLTLLMTPFAILLLINWVWIKNSYRKRLESINLLYNNLEKSAGK